MPERARTSVSSTFTRMYVRCPYIFNSIALFITEQSKTAETLEPIIILEILNILYIQYKIATCIDRRPSDLLKHVQTCLDGRMSRRPRV